MFIELLQQNGICILRFHGRLASGAELEYLEDKLEEIRAHPSPRILADLHELDSIGSTGLGFIVLAFKSATKRPGGRFMLAGANSRVRRALEVTRLSEVIPMAEDVTSGLGALRGMPATKLWRAGLSPREASAALAQSGAQAPRGLKSTLRNRRGTKGFWAW
jgi:anti-anti-sigma factor